MTKNRPKMAKNRFFRDFFFFFVKITCARMYSTDFWPKSVEYMCAHVILTKNYEKTLKNPIFGLRAKSQFWVHFGLPGKFQKSVKMWKSVKKRFYDVSRVGETIRGVKTRFYTFFHRFSWFSEKSKKFLATDRGGALLCRSSQPCQGGFLSYVELKNTPITIHILNLHNKSFQTSYYKLNFDRLSIFSGQNSDFDDIKKWVKMGQNKILPKGDFRQKIAQKCLFERFLAKITWNEWYSTDFGPKSVEYHSFHVILAKNRSKRHFWAIFDYFFVKNDQK